MSKEREIVQFTPEKLEILTQQSHEFHQVFELVMSEYGKAEMKLIDDLLSFSYKILQVIGIFAGFGFTAIQAVKHQWLFALGEIILFSGIVYGIYEVKKIYAKNLEAVQKSSRRKFDVFNKKSAFFIKYINEFADTEQLDLLRFKGELKKLDDKLLKEFSEDKETDKKKDEGEFLDRIIISAIIGSLLLLSAFIIF